VALERMTGHRKKKWYLHSLDSVDQYAQLMGAMSAGAKRRVFSPDLNLARADRTSMHVSLELRVPLLNHRLVEYACGLRQAVRNPGGRLKGLFKHAVRDRLPEAIRQRKKMGFAAPVKQWFTPGDLLALISDVRAEHPDLAAAWLNPRLAPNARKITGTRGYKLWIFLKWIQRNA